MKVHKIFPNMEVKIICTNLVFMDLINHFGVTGDVTGYINLHNPHLYFWEHKIAVHECHY